MQSLKPIMCRYGQVFLFLVLPVLAKDRFLLESELLTTYSSGSQTLVFTGYSYNDSGYRVEKSAYNGADSTAATMSRTLYLYNQDNTLSDEILETATGDTASIVHHSYDSSKRQIAVATLTKLQVLRYVDSSAYDSYGNMIAVRRYSGGSLSFYDTYSYDASGEKLSDTLHEMSGTDFIATQAVNFSYDASGFVLNEKNSRFQSGAWYLISTNKMAYSSGGHLVSVTQYEGDGTSNVMQDSLAYAYDSWGNQTRGSHFDGDHILLSTTDYTWIDTQPTAIARMQRSPEKIPLRFDQRRLLVSGGFGTVRLCIYDANGRLVRQSYHEGSAGSEFAVTPDLRRGSYVAVIKSENRASVLRFTSVN
jgi:hypothetical protein